MIKLFFFKKNIELFKEKSISIILISLGLFFFESSYFAVKAQIIPDGTFNDGLSSFDPKTNKIGGGTQRGANLFHSFEDFNVLNNQEIYFVNPIGTLNIITRVTGSNPSNINGRLGVDGKANLFLVNPKGISFGPTASLDVKGSFVATTANAVQFSGQGFFDTASKDPLPLLTVNPSGFLFNRINSAPISNSSIQDNGTRRTNDPFFRNTPRNPRLQDIPLSGLKVADKNSLILLGGEITLDNGGLYALGGQIAIGSVAGTGVVNLSFDGNNLGLSFPDDLDRSNIFLLNGSRVDASGDGFGGGNIRVFGKNIQLKGSSRIVSETTGDQDGKVITLNATDSLEIIGISRGGGVSTLTSNLGKAGDIEITARKFTLTSGAQILSGTSNRGTGGNITVNVSDFLKFNVRAPNGATSGISSTAYASGGGGNVKVNTPGNLLLSDGAFISAGSGAILNNGRFVLGTGDGGSLDLKVGNSILIDGTDTNLFAGHFAGKAGNISIDTTSLILQNGGKIIVNSPKKAGNINIASKSLTLDDGTISADTGVSGANIFLTVSNILSLGNESKITATANGSADGGNIIINTPILLALPPLGSNGSDIRADAVSGKGGNITINAQGVFGIQQRKARDGNQTNDIDASSQFGQLGQVQINTTTDPNQGLVELPATVIDPTTLVAQNPCRSASSSEFTRSGRGGLPPSLSQDLSSKTTQVGLVEPTNLSASNPAPQAASKPANSQLLSSSQIAPARGWVYNDKGEVVLVAYNSAITGPQRLQSNPKGCPVL